MSVEKDGNVYINYNLYRWIFWIVCFALYWNYGIFAINMHRHISNNSWIDLSAEYYALFSDYDYHSNNGSITGGQTPHYLEIFLFFKFHSIGAGLWLLTGIFQFIPQIRRKYPTIHRILGWMYVIFCCVGLTGSFRMIWHLGFDNQFGGAIFHVILLGYWAGAFGTLIAAIFAIIKQWVTIHRQFMVCFYID